MEHKIGSGRSGRLTAMLIDRQPAEGNMFSPSFSKQPALYGNPRWPTTWYRTRF